MVFFISVVFFKGVCYFLCRPLFIFMAHFTGVLLYFESKDVEKSGMVNRKYGNVTILLLLSLPLNCYNRRKILDTFIIIHL